jgi:creatinine amidohydrolase
VETYLRVVTDILDSMAETGFRRILIVNGHGGNSPASSLAREWMADHPGIAIKFHNWWNAPKTWAKVQAIDTVASHASWMENFPWTRLVDVQIPEAQKPMIDLALLNILDPRGLRSYLEDGNFGGRYQRPDEDMLAIWQAAVGETREILTDGWGIA